MHRINLSQHWTRRGSVHTRRFGSPRSHGSGVWLSVTLTTDGTITVNRLTMAAAANQPCRMDITSILEANNTITIDGEFTHVAMEIEES